MPKTTKTTKKPAAATASRKATATKATATKAAIKTVATPPSARPGQYEAASLVDKVTGQILMVAPRSDGTLFLINGAPHDFLIKTDHGNYAAMVSTLLAAQSGGGNIAVKYTRRVIGDEPRTVSSLAKGVHAIISGGSF